MKEPSTIGGLNRADYNPRRISPEAATALARSMAEFGDLSGLTYNIRTGRLVCGHQRRDQLPAEAALVRTESRKDSVGTVAYGYAEAHGTRWPVRFVDWPESKEKAANIAANSPFLAGEFTTDLAAILDSLKVDLPDLSAALRLEDLRSLIPEMALEPGATDPDAVPEPPDAATSRRGEIYQLGNHRLMCADSGSVVDLDALLAGAPVHLVNTDPPYNVKVEPRSNNAIAAGLSSFSNDHHGKKALLNKTCRAGHSGLTHHQGFDLARGKSKAHGTTQKLRPKDRPLENDFVTSEAFDKMLLDWFGNASRVLKPGGSFYIWGGYANLGNYPGPLKACGLYFSQGIVWDKQHPVLTRKDYMGAFEICFYGWKEGAGHKFYGPNNALDLWHIKKVNPQSMIHLTEKPVALAVQAIQYSSLIGENVLDLFGGSGSTLIACEQTGRHAYLMELDTLYCDVIRQRWAEFVHGEGADWKALTPAVKAEEAQASIAQASRKGKK